MNEPLTEDEIDEPAVLGAGDGPAPMPTAEELCDALHREEEGNEVQSIPTRDLLAITSLLDCHPEWWDYPCFCAECRSCADG